MKEDYAKALPLVLDHEGGYSNDRGDSGGPTMYGITIHDARMYWKHDATANDVRHMPLDVAKQIYRSKYWDAISGDLLPPGVDYAVFDYGVNSGIARAAMVMQRILGIPDDGRIGPITIAAANKADPVKLVAKISDERLAFLKRLSIWSIFGRGWARRVADVRTVATEMAKQ